MSQPHKPAHEDRAPHETWLSAADDTGPSDQPPQPPIDADLGAAGGGASGPGNADPNWIGANSGGAVPAAGTGGITTFDPSNPDQLDTTDEAASRDATNAPTAPANSSDRSIDQS